MELNLQRREREVKDLQAEVVRLNDEYRESYQEARDLRFELSKSRFLGRIRPGQVGGVSSSQLIGTCTTFVTMYV